jgi:hypothetical protein
MRPALRASHRDGCSEKALSFDKAFPTFSVAGAALKIVPLPESSRVASKTGKVSPSYAAPAKSQQAFTIRNAGLIHVKSIAAKDRGRLTAEHAMAASSWRIAAA